MDDQELYRVVLGVSKIPKVDILEIFNKWLFENVTINGYFFEIPDEEVPTKKSIYLHDKECMS